MAGFKIIKLKKLRRNASYKLQNPDFPFAGPLRITVREGAYGRALGSFASRAEARLLSVAWNPIQCDSNESDYWVTS